MMGAMESTMEAVVAALTEEIAALEARLDRLGAPDWARPSRCDGWTVADVVLHLAQTNEMAVASAEARLAEHVGELTMVEVGVVGSVEDGAGALVAAERGAPDAAVLARWRSSAQAMCAAFAACDGSERLQWVAGDLAARSLATTRLAETWIHAGDIAWTFDEGPEVSDRLWHIARLAWRTLPYAFAGAGRTLSGPVAFELVGPSSDAWSWRESAAPVATTVSGSAIDLCLVAGQRMVAEDSGLVAEGPDATAVLELVRTFA